MRTRTARSALVTVCCAGLLLLFGAPAVAAASEPQLSEAILEVTLSAAVKGETMVVLLCAGNRIQIPDFTQGLGAFFQPVHTMTGIIAQEMGEVAHYSIHYRALFMVGAVLFLISLLVNWLAQKIVRRYRIVAT